MDLPNGASAKSRVECLDLRCRLEMFVQILKQVAEKLGKLALAVPPHYTSQMCSSCGEIFKKGYRQGHIDVLIVFLLRIETTMQHVIF